MIQIDSHQHFWKFDPVRDAWIDDAMQVIRRDFLPKDLAPILAENGIAGCVAVQADQSETETEFLLQLANQNNFIKGVVGWVDLVASNLRERLAYFSTHSKFKGVRHIAQGEPDDFFLRPDAQKGIGQLEKFGLSYDILVFAHQLPAAIELVRLFPKQKFVLDHIAKPKISEGLSDVWQEHIQTLAQFPNVFCKLSGMVTETNNFSWSKSDFTPFIEVILNTFGTDRVLYGSDWPVCLLAANYKEQLTIVKEHISTLSQAEQAKIMGLNSIQFYNLSDQETEVG